jgi:hypothetical protein
VPTKSGVGVTWKDAATRRGHRDRAGSRIGVEDDVQAVGTDVVAERVHIHRQAEARVRAVVDGLDPADRDRGAREFAVQGGRREPGRAQAGLVVVRCVDRVLEGVRGLIREPGIGGVDDRARVVTSTARPKRGSVTTLRKVPSGTVSLPVTRMVTGVPAVVNDVSSAAATASTRTVTRAWPTTVPSVEISS